MKHKTEITGTSETPDARVTARDALRGDIAGAVASAVTLGLIAVILFAATTSSTEYDAARFVRILAEVFVWVSLSGAACYLAPVAASHLMKSRVKRRFIPGWVLTAVCGSLLFTVFTEGHAAADKLRHAEAPDVWQLRLALILFAALNVITLPVFYGARRGWMRIRAARFGG